MLTFIMSKLVIKFISIILIQFFVLISYASDPVKYYNKALELELLKKN